MPVADKSVYKLRFIMKKLLKMWLHYLLPRPVVLRSKLFAINGSWTTFMIRPQQIAWPASIVYRLHTSSTIHGQVDSCDKGTFRTSKIQTCIGYIFRTAWPTERDSSHKACSVGFIVVFAKEFRAPRISRSAYPSSKRRKQKLTNQFRLRIQGRWSWNGYLWDRTQPP